MESVVATAPKKVRLSGIELLKVIAILLICFSHCAMSLHNAGGGTLVPELCQLSAISYFTMLCRCFGNIGNTLFIIASAYFLVSSKKADSSKVINIMLDSFFISISFLIGFLISGKYSFSNEEIVACIFPDFHALNWFIPCYILLYAMHPLLNIVMDNIKKEIHLLIIVVTIVLWGTLDVFYSKLFGNELVSFISIYFLVGYLKKYAVVLDNKKVHLIGYSITTLLFLGVFSIVFFTNIETGTIPLFVRLLSPLTLPMCVFMFYIFKNMKFQSKCINYLSSLSLFIYLIHENYLFRNYMRPQLFEMMFAYNADLSLLWLLSLGLLCFIGGSVLAAIYNASFRKIIKLVALSINKFVCFVCKKVTSILYK